jgi:hypothetical protein
MPTQPRELIDSGSPASSSPWRRSRPAAATCFFHLLLLIVFLQLGDETKPSLSLYDRVMLFKDLLRIFARDLSEVITTE